SSSSYNVVPIFPKLSIRACKTQQSTNVCRRQYSSPLSLVFYFEGEAGTGTRGQGDQTCQLSEAWKKEQIGPLFKIKKHQSRYSSFALQLQMMLSWTIRPNYFVGLDKKCDRIAESYQEQLPEAEVIPETLVIAQGNIYGVSNIAKSKSCLLCGNRVIPKNDKISNCTKCRMTAKLQSCLQDWQLKIHVPTSQKKTVRLSVFNSEIGLLFPLCDLDPTCNEETS
ncbi:Hypothetical predicted protein, partial [Paramuricea clavata]